MGAIAPAAESRTIHLGDGLDVSPEIFTTATALLGIRNSGKTNGGTVIAEGATALGVPTVVIDPTSVWWGLKSSADGKRPGLPFVVFGGERGDVPLDPDAGAAAARFVVDKRVPLVLDVSDFSKGKQRRFVGQFLSRLYDLKNRERFPLLVIIDEAQTFVPQLARNPDFDTNECIGAVEDIGQKGRSRGLGLVLIGPRSSVVNKNVLATCDNLFALRMTAPQDRKAIKEWLSDVGGDDEEDQHTDELFKNLPTLRNGEGYFWSPAVFGVFKRTKFALRSTFDSSRTPKIGETIVEPTVWAKIDLAEIGGEMAAAVERAKQDDPRALRAEIARLRDATGTDPAVERELRARIAELEAREPERVEVPAFTDSDIRHLDVVARALQTATDRIGKLVEAIQAEAPLLAALGGCAERLESVRAAVAGRAAAVPAAARPEPVLKPQRPVPMSVPQRAEAPSRARNTSDGDLDLGGGAPNEILMALATFPDGVSTRRRLGALTGYSSRKSTIRNALSRLRVAGLIETPDGETVVLTAAGRTVAGPPEPPKPTRETIDLWRGKLGDGAPRNLFETLVSTYPRGLGRTDLGHRSGVDPSTSTLRNALSKLRTNGLIVEQGDDVRASDALFPTGPLR